MSEAEAAALAEAEDLQGATPKKSPGKTPSKAATPKASPKASPKSVRKKPGMSKRQAKPKAEPKLKRPASKREEVDQEKEPEKKEEKSKEDKKNKRRKEDEAKAQALTLEDQGESAVDGDKQESLAKVKRDGGKAYFFHRNFTKLPEEARNMCLFPRNFSQRFHFDTIFLIRRFNKPSTRRTWLVTRRRSWSTKVCRRTPLVTSWSRTILSWRCCLLSHPAPRALRRPKESPSLSWWPSLVLKWHWSVPCKLVRLWRSQIRAESFSSFRLWRLRKRRKQRVECRVSRPQWHPMKLWGLWQIFVKISNRLWVTWQW